MSRPIQWLVKAVIGILVVNSALVVINKSSSTDRSTVVKNSVIQSSSMNQCCYCSNSELTYNIKHHDVDYRKIALEIPSLDPSYRTGTLTRLGTDLNFDYGTCPRDSYMLQDNVNTTTPLHLDCPTLFIIGARKGGTTSLYQYISKHSDFEGTSLDRGPKAGETYHFSSKYTSESWVNYLKHFPSDDVMSGEASVGYFVKCQVPKRLFESCGKQARIVMVLRDPIERFVSNFLMRARLRTTKIGNTTSLSTLVKLNLDAFFHSALTKGIDVTKMAEQWTKLLCIFGPAENMVYEGIYYVHLLNWMCNFPRENIMIVNSEEFYRNASVILDQVVQFLGLKRLDHDTYDFITANVFNTRGNYDIPEYQKLSLVDKKNLIGAYRPFNEALMELLDWQESVLKWNLGLQIEH